MTTLEAIPSAFVALHRAGRFDYWGAPYRSLTEEQRAQRMRARRTQVLWWQSIEWDRHPDAIAAFEGDDQLRPGLIPFAGDGAGDLFCWYPRWQTGPEPPVVLFVHDELHSRLFAASFTECLCRCFLQDFTWADEDDGDGDGRPSKQARWEAHLAILQPFLSAEQNELLASVGARPSRSACEEADKRIAARLGTRTLIGAQQPTRYNEKMIRERATLLRLYDQSIAFYRELIEDEGLTAFQDKLAQTEAARANVIAVAAKDRRASKQRPKPPAAARKGKRPVRGAKKKMKTKRKTKKSAPPRAKRKSARRGAKSG